MVATINPMHQFELVNVVNINFFGYNISLTNGSIVFGITVAVAMLIGIVLKKTKNLVPSLPLAALEMSLLAIKNITSNSLGEAGKKHVPFVFSLFLFVLLLNLLGLIPGSFAQTSHISVTFTLAIMVFIICLLITIIKMKFSFFKIFIPSGTPLWLAPLLFILELFSYLVRPVSLSVRLAANMIAGHVMLDVIAFFTVMMGVFGILPFAFLSILMAFELFVAFLQAYIFSVFACVYINEACHGGH